MADREELFTPDELAVRLDEWANCLDKSQWDLRSDMRCAAIHLRRFASSDSGVKVKPLVWRDHRPDSFPEPSWSAQTPFGFYNIEEVSASDSPAYVVRLHAHHFVADKDSLDAAKAAAQADYEARIKSTLVEVPTVKGEPEPVAWQYTHIKCPDWKGSVASTVRWRNTEGIYQERPLYTAPPADAGMREALTYAESLAVVLWSKHFKDIAPHWKPLTGDLIGLLTQIDNMTTALTAPGATTKSDGGEVITAEQMDAIETAAIAGQPLADPDWKQDQAETTRIRPSDPSPTRSDVTVESLADWLNKRGSLIAKAALSNPGRHSTIDLARALLDQFEIRRK